MITNEKGSSLLTVMLILVILTSLGVVIMSVSINGALRTEIRETEVDTNIEELTYLKEGIARIENFVASSNTNLSSLTIEEYDHLISQFLYDVNHKENLQYSIENISDSDEYAPYIGNSQTRVLKITTEQYSQNVFLTAMPSFLKYAIGSRENLTINGSVAIDGDLYAKDSLNISNNANYIYHSKKLRAKTEFPAFIDLLNETNNKIGNVYVESNDLTYCSLEEDCYNEDLLKIEGNWKTLTNLQDAFSFGNPVQTIDSTPYIDVDLYETFIDKLSDNGFNKTDFHYVQNDVTMKEKLTDLYRSNKKLKVITSFDTLQQEASISESFYYEGNAYIDTNIIDLGKDDWLIINGDAHFENSGSEKMYVNANILVTGNLTIKGDFSFKSVMYTLGENATLNNVNITNDLNDEFSTFILITDGVLEMARVNKFNDWNNNTQLINGFIYTTKSAEVYGVGSLMNINGGIFSKQNLTVNAFRGNAEEGENSLVFTPLNENPFASRFIVKNDKRLFFNQLEALPKVNQLEIIPDRIEKNK